jgi:hypothetical protein
VALWHITLTLGGDDIEAADVLEALRRLADEQPFLLSGRYAGDRAELRYWEEATDCQDAAALALRLWGEHRASAGLPPWQVIGLEVVNEDVHRARGGAETVVAVGAWRPF